MKKWQFYYILVMSAFLIVSSSRLLKEAAIRSNGTHNFTALLAALPIMILSGILIFNIRKIKLNIDNLYLIKNKIYLKISIIAIFLLLFINLIGQIFMSIKLSKGGLNISSLLYIIFIVIAIYLFLLAKFFIEIRKASVTSKSVSNHPNANGIYNNFSEYGLPNFQFELSGDLGVDTMSAVVKIDKGMKKKNLPFDFKGFFFIKLFEEGALKVPIVFKSGNKAYALFFIYNEEQAKLFNLYKDYLPDSDFPNALYISTINCKKITGKTNRLPSFKLSDLDVIENPKLKGNFGMWWQEANDKVFHTSKTKKYLDGIFESMKDYESYMFGYLLSEIKVKGFDKFQRVKLPVNNTDIVVEGPEYLNIVISVSQEKGIKFHFPIGKASLQYRERFLKHIYEIFKAFRLTLIMNKMPKDEKTDENGYDWYKFMTKFVEKKEKEEGQIDEFIIGRISYD